jgi:hypothetical protein
MMGTFEELQAALGDPGKALLIWFKSTDDEGTKALYLRMIPTLTGYADDNNAVYAECYFEIILNNKLVLKTFSPSEAIEKYNMKMEKENEP